MRGCVRSRRAISAGLPRSAARKRFECPSGARNAACGTQRRIPPGHAPAAHSKGPVAFARRVRRVAAPAAVGASPRPPLAPWVRVCPGPPRASVSSALLAQETRLAAPPRSPSRSLPPAPAVRGLEGRSPPKCIRIARLRRAGGEFAPLGANIPYAASRPGVLRRRTRGKRRNPAEKAAAGGLFRRTLRVYKQSVNTAPAA